MRGVKRLIKRALLGPQPIPQWAVTALRDPQQDVRVSLEGLGPPQDVTANNVVAALRPLTLAICLDAARHPALLPSVRPRLVFRSTSEDRVLGTVSLTPRKWLPAGGHRYCLFETTGHTNYCVPRPRLWFHYGMHIRAMRNDRTPYNFKLAPRELLRLLVFYICPRPVVLVTVAWREALNLFPMDLVGPTDSGFFSLALRSTSPAVELMKASRRLALASPPFEYKDQVYSLGKHHRAPSIDPATLPFETDLSPTFGLPIVAAALRVREVEIHQAHVVGSHTVFLTRVVSDERRSQHLQLFHTCGFYQYYLERHGRAAPERVVASPSRNAQSENQPHASPPPSS